MPLRASGTSTAICCCARPRNSTTTASGSTGIARQPIRRGGADLIGELLPLLDDLERALAAEADSDAAVAYRTGVELIHKQLLDLLAKRGVSPIDTAGQQFDPHLHEAVVHEESADHAAGEIIGELRRGYVMGTRLLRATMVRVAKA